jgi:hypothetical protein
MRDRLGFGNLAGDLTTAGQRHIEQVVIRTVGTAPDPVRYLYANQPEAPRMAHASPARQPAQHDMQAPALMGVSAVQKAFQS